jgi:hypothetical protein
MKTLIALAAALGLIFAVAESGFARERPSTSHGGQIKNGKVKRSLPLRTAPSPDGRAPETQGGSFDENKGAIIYF